MYSIIIIKIATKITLKNSAATFAWQIGSEIL